MPEEVSPHAGKHLKASMLVDLPRLVTAYFARKPDPANRAERVAFGTSGHRGSAFDGVVQRGAYPGDHPGDLPLPRGKRASTGRFSSARTRMRLSEPAFVSALEVLAANDVKVAIDA